MNHVQAWEPSHAGSGCCLVSSQFSGPARRNGTAAVVEPDSDCDYTEPGDDATRDAKSPQTGVNERTEDLIRIYLVQMGEIPLLDREAELRTAADRAGAESLPARHTCHGLRLAGSDRHVGGRPRRPLPLRPRSGRLYGQGPGETAPRPGSSAPTWTRCARLLRRNRADYAVAIDRRQPSQGRREVWRRLVSRRGRAMRLVEELGLRTQLLRAGV